MADFTFVEGNVPSAATWNTTVRDQLVTICTSSTRPASPVANAAIYETDTYRRMRYVGGSWVQVGQIGAWSTYTPSWTSTGTAPAIGNGTIAGRWQRLNARWNAVAIKMTFGSTTTFGTGNYSLSLPSGMGNVAANAFGKVAIYAATNYFGTANAYTNASTITLGSVTAGNNTTMTNVTPTVPVTLASTHYILVSLVVEGTSST